MHVPLQILSDSLLEAYAEAVDDELMSRFNDLKDAEISTESFSFYTSVSAIASSRIEGEKMDIDSYVKHKMQNVAYQPELVEKPNDLYKAYIWAQDNALTKDGFFTAHALLAQHLLHPATQGALRIGNMVVLEHNTGRIQYEAAPASDVSSLYSRLWQDIDALGNTQLSIKEVFYFAAYIHLVFVNIHPFEDGNGRAGRLLEKWFVARHLGPKAWYLQSEWNYYGHVNDYYKNLNRLGMFYDKLDYTKALPFLLMLPNALVEQQP